MALVFPPQDTPTVAVAGSDDRIPVRRIFCIGRNYAAHAREMGRDPDREPPFFFLKPADAVVEDGATIPYPPQTENLHYEAELVAVIGKGGRHISAADASKHIFGYAVGNDVSVRDWQRKTAQWLMGKSFDTHAPFGPSIVTSDEVGDPHRLDITCKVNGEVRQSSNTKQLLFDVFAQVEELSQAMTLKPGDLIFTGTPGGVGLAMKPPVFLKEGDVVTCEIEELGAITNKVVAEA